MKRIELPHRIVPSLGPAPPEVYVPGANGSSHFFPGSDNVEVDAFGQLRATWDTLIKHQWLILATACLLCVLVTIYSFKMKPVYQSTARVDIEAEVPFLQSLNDLFRPTASDVSSLGTQLSILQSDALIWQTIQETGLAKQTPSTKAPQSQGQVVGTPPSMKNAIIAGFKQRLHLEQIKDTRIVSVSLRKHRSPRGCAGRQHTDQELH